MADDGDFVTMSYIRKFYGVPAERGGRVEVNYRGSKRAGVIFGAYDAWLLVRVEGVRFALTYHPDDCRYEEVRGCFGGPQHDNKGGGDDDATNEDAAQLAEEQRINELEMWRGPRPAGRFV